MSDQPIIDIGVYVEIDGIRSNDMTDLACRYLGHVVNVMQHGMAAFRFAGEMTIARMNRETTVLTSLGDRTRVDTFVVRNPELADKIAELLESELGKPFREVCK